MCQMKLVKQTHPIALQLFDAPKNALQGPLVRLAIQGGHGMMQGLNLNGNGYDEGDFHLMPGPQQLSANRKISARSSCPSNTR